VAREKRYEQAKGQRTKSSWLWKKLKTELNIKLSYYIFNVNLTNPQYHFFRKQINFLNALKRALEKLKIVVLLKRKASIKEKHKLNHKHCFYQSLID